MNVLRISGGHIDPAEIDNSLEALQAAVGGYIEVVPLTSKLAVICNEEGKLIGLPVTATLSDDVGRLHDMLHGDLIVCRTTENGEFADIQVDDYPVINVYLTVARNAT